MLLYFLPSIQNIASTTFPAEIHISNPYFHLSILYCKNIQRKQGGIGGYSTYSIRNLSVGIEGYRLVDKLALWAYHCRAQVCDPDNDYRWKKYSGDVGLSLSASILCQKRHLLTTVDSYYLCPKENCGVVAQRRAAFASNLVWCIFLSILSFVGF